MCGKGRDPTPQQNAMSSEPPWACLPASHVSATLTSRGETLKIDDPMKKFYRMGRHQEMVDIHVKCQARPAPLPQDDLEGPHPCPLRAKGPTSPAPRRVPRPS